MASLTPTLTRIFLTVRGWGFWAYARASLRPRIWPLYNWRGRHVTRFLPPSSRFPLWIVHRTSVSLQFHTRHFQFKFQSMMNLAVRRQSARFRWAHPPVTDTHPPLSIDKRYALLPISCADTNIHLRVTKLTPNSISRAPTSLPTGAPHTVSTEHDRDSQRS